METKMLDAIIESTAQAAFFAGPVEEAELIQAEERLGQRFPGEYRAFLSSRGCGSIGSLELLGLGIPEKGVPNLMFVVCQLETAGFRVSPDILPVSPIGDGSYIAVVANSLGEYEPGQMVVWNPSRKSVLDGIEELSCHSFNEWLSGQILAQ